MIERIQEYIRNRLGLLNEADDEASRHELNLIDQIIRKTDSHTGTPCNDQDGYCQSCWVARKPRA
jgi:hypothetical protein